MHVHVHRQSPNLVVTIFIVIHVMACNLLSNDILICKCGFTIVVNTVVFNRSLKTVDGSQV